MLRTIIIDKEEAIRHSVRDTIDRCCPNVLPVAEADNVERGLSAVHAHHPDLVFLDTGIDEHSGFDLLDQLMPLNFKIIFLARWNKTTIRTFRCCALDYLLKPIDRDDLTHAVKKSRQVSQEDFNAQVDNLRDCLQARNTEAKKIILRFADSMFPVQVRNILYGQADGNHIIFQLSDRQRVMASSTLKEYEDMLADCGFVRVHKSYLVNTRHISALDNSGEGYVVMNNSSRIPLSARRKSALQNMVRHIPHA